MMKKINFPRNLFLLKMFVCSCTKKFWQDCRNFASKNTKQFPIVQIRWSYNFFIRNCFHQKWFSSNGECIFDNPTKKFFLETTDLSLRFQKKREIMNFLDGRLFFLKLCFCTYRIHLWPPREKFVVKTLKTFRSNSGKDEKPMRFPNKIVSPQNVRLNMHNEILRSLP